MGIDLSGGVVSGQPGTPSADPSTLQTPGSQAGSIFNDTLTPSIGLNVQTSVVDTTPGPPLLEYLSTGSSATELLRHLLYEALQQQELSQLDFAQNVISSMATLQTILNQVIDQALSWNDPLTGKVVTVAQAYQALKDKYTAYNNTVTTQATGNNNDSDQIKALNTAYTKYESLTSSSTPQEINDAISNLQKQITIFNTYAQGRPDLPQITMPIPPDKTSIVDDTNTFNTNEGPINTQIQQINAALANSKPPIPPFDPLTPLPIPSANPEYPSINQQPQFNGTGPPPSDVAQKVAQYLKFFAQSVTPYRTQALQDALDAVAKPKDRAAVNAAITLALTQGPGPGGTWPPPATEGDFFNQVRTDLGTSLGQTGTDYFDKAIFNLNPLGVPTTDAEQGLITVPTQTETVPQIQLSDFMMANWFPIAIPILALVALLQSHLALFQALVDQENFLNKNKVGYINYPAAYIQRTNRAFVANVASSGSGVGLGSFAVGLQTRRLESVLSNAITKAIAQKNNFPVSGQLFIRSHYSVLDILHKSALLGSLQGASLFANLLGWEGATDEPLALGLSIGFSERLANLIQGNVSRALTNGTFNQVAFSSRLASQIAKDQVATGETQLKNAINTGDPDQINNAVSNLALAQSKLSGATHLYNTFGTASVGGMAQMTDQVSSTMNLSLLSVALAQFGQTIGLPGLVPQFFANFTGLPTNSILGALSAGSNIGDVLDNPLSMIFLKQTLLDTLGSQAVAANPAVPGIINNAIDNLVLNGDIGTTSQLQAQLVANFRQQGLGQLDAFKLGAAGTGLVVGDIGVKTLNAGMTPNINSAAVASAVANGINFNTQFPDLNSTIQNQLGNPNLVPVLQNAIAQASGVQMSTQREFRNQVAQNLGSSGLSQAASIFLANSASNVVTNGTAASGTGSSPNDIAVLESSLAASIAHQFAVSVEKAAEIVKEALHHAFMTAPYSNPDQLNIAIQEGLVNAAGNAGLPITHAAAAFNQALAALPNAGTILPLSGLVDQVTEAINGKVKGHPHLARQLNNAVLQSLFGGTSADEIQNNQNPLSFANLLKAQVQKLIAQDDAAQSDAMVQKLTQLMATLTRPNAAIGYTMTSLMDHPTTLISNLAMASQNKRDTDIPLGPA